MPTIIRSVRTTSGFLLNAKVEFARGLTCVIGARGTCKSTLIETIRFAFHCNPERVEQLLTPHKKAPGGDVQANLGLVRATLGAGRVCCEVSERTAEGDYALTVEREIDALPQVYREGVRELSDTSVLNRVEIYSQGDLQLIAEQDRLRLDLIDRPHKARIDDLKARRERHAHALREIGPTIRVRRVEIESKRVEVRSMEELRAQLTDLQRSRPTLSEELDRERAEFLQRKTLLEGLDETLQVRRAVLDKVRVAASVPDSLDVTVASLADLDVPEAAALRSLLEEFRDFVQATARAAGDAAASETAAEAAAVRKHLEGRNERYYALRQDQQALNDSLKREDTLKQQITHLEKVQAELERLEADVAGLIRRRQECREAIRRLGDEIYALRLREVEDINARYSDVIVLTLEQGVRSPGYQDKLSALLKGSNLRNQSDVVRDLAEKVRPSDLVDVVETSDVARLAAALGRDSGQMTRLIAFVNDDPALYDLEGVIFEDRLEITMYDDGVLKEVGQLSKGQMATALLPLILRTADYPLIFDQPEDDLDNRFIFKTLVERIRQLKRERQLIFVTHNANIPVLGEADRVVVMRMDTPLSAAAPTSGSVDEVKEHILTLLEGGKEAFRQRQVKYKSLLG